MPGASTTDCSTGRYILITKEEAEATLAERFGDVEQFWSPKRGGYIGGFDMFHTLHCLVRIILKPLCNIMT
jgi:hypothetical protein